ncbi:MAG TPA: hypothetical protein VHX38_26445 [Pseudonocardiaceae bacterium]|nr:hypothetical protein [Pseudonocardiaceae bacterium]
MLGLISVGAGLAIDPENFAVGILASLAALALTVLTATLIFDELAEQRAAARKREKWDIIRIATLAAIWDQIRRITLPIAERSPDGEYFSVDYKNTLKIMGEVSSWIPTQAVPLDRDDPEGVAQYEACKNLIARLYRDVARECVYLRDVLTPRVLDLADDVDAVEPLYTLDDMERQWSSVVFSAGPGEIENAWQAFPEAAWTAVSDFYGAAIDVARWVAGEPDMPTPRTLQLILVKIDGEWVHRCRTIRGERS